MEAETGEGQWPGSESWMKMRQLERRGARAAQGGGWHWEEPGWGRNLWAGAGAGFRMEMGLWQGSGQNHLQGRKESKREQGEQRQEPPTLSDGGSPTPANLLLLAGVQQKGTKDSPRPWQRGVQSSTSLSPGSERRQEGGEWEGLRRGAGFEG